MNDFWRSVEEEEIQIPFLGQKMSGERRGRKTLKTSEEERVRSRAARENIFRRM